LSTGLGSQGVGLNATLEGVDVGSRALVPEPIVDPPCSTCRRGWW